MAETGESWQSAARWVRDQAPKDGKDKSKVDDKTKNQDGGKR